MTDQGGGIEFLADGTCKPVKKHGAVWTCRWKKRDDGEYEVTTEGDVGGPITGLFHIDGDHLILPASNRNRKPFALARVPAE